MVFCYCQDYWLSLLHRQLVGTVVLHVRLSSSPNTTRVYAHCTRWCMSAVYRAISVAEYSCNTNQLSTKNYNVSTIQVSNVASRQHLRSASQWLLVLPWHQLQTYGRRAFSVAGPSAWNSLPDNLRDLSVSRDSFLRLLKTHLFTLYWSIQRIREEVVQ